MSGLPFIDEHSRVIEAPPEAVWGALCSVTAGSFSNGPSQTISNLLGCEQTERAGPAGEEGSTFPGFRVARSVPPRELGLRGRHRFSDYELAFVIEELGGGRSRLRARTLAAFPGLRGRAYRALVIGTRGHVLATTRILAAVARRAEKAEAAPHPGVPA